MPVLTAARGSEQVRALNDAFRCSFIGGRVIVIAGVMTVRAFDRFDTDNDPHGEHDFGTVAVGDVRVLWKIDTFDRALTCPSCDPADPTVTTRVLTVILSKEY